LHKKKQKNVLGYLNNEESPSQEGLPMAVLHESPFLDGLD
jgi:hypothetical protein